MKPGYWILDGTTPVQVDDLTAWAIWFEGAERHVGYTKRLNVTVSTVFLGIDHNFGSEGDPVLFETMVFGGKHDGVCRRSSTWEQAEAQHKAVCDEVLVGE